MGQAETEVRTPDRSIRRYRISLFKRDSGPWRGLEGRGTPVSTAVIQCDLESIHEICWLTGVASDSRFDLVIDEADPVTEEELRVEVNTLRAALADANEKLGKAVDLNKNRPGVSGETPDQNPGVAGATPGADPMNYKG